MSDEGYQGGGTAGGKWGCATAAIVGLPVFVFAILLASLGDCAPDVQCHKSFWFAAFLPTFAVAAPVGFGVRWIINRWHQRDN